MIPAWRRGKRAGLITPRSLDRNELPVFIITSHRCSGTRAKPHLLSSEAEREAHNFEVDRIKTIRRYCQAGRYKRSTLFQTTSMADVYRLTPTLLTAYHRWSERRMVIFFIIKRTVWDRYLQVVIVKLDAINVATILPTWRRGSALGS